MRAIKHIIAIVIIYLIIGFFYGMCGEFRLARKYCVIEKNSSPKIEQECSFSRIFIKMIVDPYTYLRSAVSAPFWPWNLYWTVHHCGNPFGCALEDGRI